MTRRAQEQQQAMALQRSDLDEVCLQAGDIVDYYSPMYVIHEGGRQLLSSASRKMTTTPFVSTLVRSSTSTP
jgi:hypothetical protein